MFRWAITNELAGGHRPGYPREEVDQSDVDLWIAEVRALGITSIICFLADDQLGFYNNLPGGLISYYRKQGFTVDHIPARDYQQPPLTAENLERVWEAYGNLPKPVLLHCSAGIDRTRVALEHLQRQLKENARASTSIKGD